MEGSQRFDMTEIRSGRFDLPNCRAIALQFGRLCEILSENPGQTFSRFLFEVKRHRRSILSVHLAAAAAARRATAAGQQQPAKPHPLASPAVAFRAIAAACRARGSQSTQSQQAAARATAARQAESQAALASPAAAFRATCRPRGLRSAMPQQQQPRESNAGDSLATLSSSSLHAAIHCHRVSTAKL